MFPAFRRCGVSANGLVIIAFTLNLLSISVLYLYGQLYPIIVWIFHGLWGLSSAPVLPLALTYANIFFRPSPSGFCLAVVALGCGDSLYSFLSGFLTSHFDTSVLMYLWLSSAGFCFLFYVPLLPLLAGQTRRLTRSKVKSKKKMNQNSKKAAKL